MCYCEGESAAFSSETHPVARKAHRCVECRGTIALGERYLRYSGKWDGELDSFAICLTCRAWSKALVEAQREACGESCWLVGMLWDSIAEFCEEHLGYCPRAPKARAA